MAYRIGTLIKKEKNNFMNTPNKISLSRLVIAFIIIILFSLSFLPTANNFAPDFVIAGFHIGFNWIDLVCFVLFIAGSITDAIDGHMARSRNLVTDFGKFLDPVADKFLVDSALILLCARTDFANHYQIFPIIVVLFIGRDLAMDGLRMVASSKGVVLAANKWGKIKTALEMTFIPMLFLNGFPFSIIPNYGFTLETYMTTRFEYTYLFTNLLALIALFFSLLSFGIYIYQNKKVILESK